MKKALGRRIPSDWRHVERYALTSATMNIGVPVLLGINWYSDFDYPVEANDGEYWIGLDRYNLGYIRGGHCLVAKSDHQNDYLDWWRFYDQGEEGACVGFGGSRMMSLLNRKRYSGTWLYDQAQRIDEYPDTPPEEGTSVRAGLEILRTKGPRRPSSISYRRPEEGISAYRWATSVDQIREVLDSPRHDRKGGIPLLNSWGEGYPHFVWMPYSTLEMLLEEDGEAGLVTDR